MISCLIIYCYFANNPAGIAGSNDSARYILCNNAAGTDNTPVTDSNSSHDFYITSKPHFIADIYRLTHAAAVYPFLRINGMINSIYPYIGTEQCVIPDLNFCAIKNDTAKIDIHIIPN